MCRISAMYAEPLGYYMVILSLEASKLLSMKLYVIEIMTRIYIQIPGTMQNRTCSYSMLKIFSFYIQTHLNAFIDNSLGPLGRESPCIFIIAEM
jgi:hypothetical protein